MAIGALSPRAASRPAGRPSLGRGRRRALPAALPRPAGRDGGLRRLHREGHGCVHARQFRRLRPNRPVRPLLLELALRFGNVGRAGLDFRAAARLFYLALRLSRRGARPDARLHPADHAALRRRRGNAALVRPQRHRKPSPRRRLRHQDSLHGRAQRRDLRRGRALLSLHPHQPLGSARQYRSRDGGGGAEPRLVRLPALPPHRPAARDAGLRRGRLARLREGVRRPRDPAAPQREGHAGASRICASPRSVLPTRWAT